MKKIALVSIVFSFVCLTSSVYAEESRRFRTSALWHIAAIPAYFFLEINVHEGSHVLSSMMTGATITRYRPYPHIYTNNNGDDVFLIGQISTVWRENPEDSVKAFTVLAPAITQISMFMIADTLLTFIPGLSESFFGPTTYLAGMLFPWVDFVFNLYSNALVNDFRFASEFLGQRRALFYSVGTAVAAIGLFRLIWTGFRVFTERVDEDRNERRGFVFHASPLVGEVNGLAISFQM